MKLQTDLFILCSCLIQWDTGLSLSHKDSDIHPSFEWFGHCIGYHVTKEDLSLVQQAQVHKNIRTNFRHRSLICMVHKILLNPSNLSTSDFFSVEVLICPELCWSIPRDASAPRRANTTVPGSSPKCTWDWETRPLSFVVRPDPACVFGLWVLHADASEPF